MKLKTWDNDRKMMQTCAPYPRVEYRHSADGVMTAVNYDRSGNEQELLILTSLGVYDIDGTELWQGDVVHVVKGKFGISGDEVWVVERGYFGDCQWYVSNQVNSGRLIETGEYIDKRGNCTFPAQFNVDGTEMLICKVIGNIYENPEYNQGV